METTTTSPLEPTQSNIKTKTRLGIFESLVIVLSIIVGLFLWTFGQSASLFVTLQKYTLLIWLVLSFNWLYRKASLFGGSAPNINDLEQEHNLSTKQKIIVTLSSIIFPTLVGIIVVGIWRVTAPMKARKANIICMSVFILEFLIGFVVGIAIHG